MQMRHSHRWFTDELGSQMKPGLQMGPCLQMLVLNKVERACTHHKGVQACYSHHFLPRSHTKAEC